MTDEPPFDHGDLVQRTTGSPPMRVISCRPDQSGTGWLVCVQYKQGGERRALLVAAADLCRVR